MKPQDKVQVDAAGDEPLLDQEAVAEQRKQEIDAPDIQAVRLRTRPEQDTTVSPGTTDKSATQSRLETRDKLTILWNEYKDQNDWQRHNESQRAQLSSILLAISAALVTLLPKGTPLTKEDWPIPAFLMVIGLFGILAVLKYWERFMRHTGLERAYRNQLDNYLAEKSGEELFQVSSEEDENRTELPEDLTRRGPFLRTRIVATVAHNQSTILLKDRFIKQHLLWGVVFGIIAILGAVLLLRALL